MQTNKTANIEQVKTSKLIPYAQNAKKHDEAQVIKIAASIREFGFNNPVLIDGDNGIIAGHGRVMAAQKLDLAVVPCLRLLHLSETQKRAYIIADNKLAEIGGGWDEQILRTEAKFLFDQNVDLESLGFTDAETDDLLNAQKIVEEVAEKIEREQSLQIEPEQEYLVILAKDQNEWDEMMTYFQLKKVRRGGYKEGSAFDAVGTERVLSFERIKNANCNPK
jgi:ParB-like chromosome segregation protein Spo0J